MAKDSGYPNNLLKQDQCNSPHGGAPKDVFDGDAATFLFGWVRDLAEWFLSHIRVAHSTQCPVTQDAVVVGDMLAMDVSRATTDGNPYIGKYSTIGSTNGVFLGLALEAVGAGSRLRIAASGPVSVRVTGLTPQAAGAAVAPNFTTNRLKTWAAGEEQLGISDTAGNILLFNHLGA